MQEPTAVINQTNTCVSLPSLYPAYAHSPKQFSSRHLEKPQGDRRANLWLALHSGSAVGYRIGFVKRALSMPASRLLVAVIAAGIITFVLGPSEAANGRPAATRSLQDVIGGLRSQYSLPLLRVAATNASTLWNRPGESESQMDLGSCRSRCSTSAGRCAARDSKECSRSRSIPAMSVTTASS